MNRNTISAYEFAGKGAAMVANARTIEIEPGSETARLLDEAERAPLVLVLGRRRFRLEPEGESETDDPDPWANYDPEKAVAGMMAAAGSISEEEAERWKADIRRWRAEGSRPPDRP